MIAAQAHLDPRFKHFPNLPEDEYESILAVPILARGEKLEGALNVRTREPREFTEDEIELLLAIAAQVAQSIEHAKLYAEAQRRVHELEALARISEAVSESLYLEESLEAIVKTTMDALSTRPARRSCSRTARSRGRRAAPARTRCGCRCAGSGRQIGELVCDRDTPFTRRRPRAARARSRSTRPWRSSTGARSCAACSPRRSTTGSRTTCRPSPRCCGCRRARRSVDPRKALDGLGQPDPRDRGRARGADRAARRRRRPRRAARAAARDARAGPRRREARRGGARAGLARRPPRDRARARLHASCSRTRSSTAAATVRVELARRDGDVVLAIADDGGGHRRRAPTGTGLSIVRALVRDELRGHARAHGRAAASRAEVVFPA